MAGRWPTRKVRDFTEHFLSGDPFNKLEYSMTGIPVISKGDISRAGKVNVPFDKFIDLNVLEKKGYSLTRESEIIVSTRDLTQSADNLGILGKVPIGGPYLVNQGANRLKLNDKIDHQYFIYWSRGYVFRDYVKSCAIGSTQIHLRKEDFLSAPIAFPPLTIQRQIAAILSAFDDKIELNRRMNHTLEQIARALFKSWFVDFDPVRAKMRSGQPEGMDAETAALFPDRLVEVDGKEVPEGWEVKTVGDVFTLYGGSTPSTTNPAFWDKGEFHWTTPKDMSGLDVPFLTRTERRITRLAAENISSGVLPAGTVLLSSRAPVGYLAIANMPVSINQGYIALDANGTIGEYFVLNLLQSRMQEIKGMASGTTFVELSKSAFRHLKIVLPGQDLTDVFEKQVKYFYLQIRANIYESAQLARLRDALLPRLLAEEIDLRGWGISSTTFERLGEF